MNPPLLKSNIKPLPPYLIDQIKAGEVIERPASLIKEILENSLDAGATKIHLIIEGGGLELMAIEDNGAGMGRHELPYAFQRHSTSKIQRFEDLYRLPGFGFRGEALASIASISRISCTSDTQGDHRGGKIIIEGGRQISLYPAKRANTGTSLYVRDLFYNTPVRLKFIKSAVSEKNAIKKVLNAFLLSFPQVSFSIKWDQLEKEIYPAVSQEQIEKRIRQVFFKRNNPEKLLKVDYQFENYHLNGYLSLNSTAGYTSKNQFLLVNNRYITDRSLHTAILRTMETLWGTGRSGAYLLKYVVPQEEVDINVHPGKMQVHFEKSSLLFSLTSAAVKTILKTNNPSNKKGSPLKQQYTHGIPVNNKFDGKSNPSFRKLSEWTGENFYHPISSKYQLMEWKGKNCVIHWKRLALQHLFSAFFSSIPLKENEIIPLLIGEPIDCFKPHDIDFSWLKKRGLELEALDEKTLILRNIPMYLHEFPLQETIESFLSFLKKRSFQLDKCQIDFQKDYILPSFIPSCHLVKNCLNGFSMEELQKRNILCQLNENMLDNCWQI